MCSKLPGTILDAYQYHLQVFAIGPNEYRSRCENFHQYSGYLSYAKLITRT